MFKKWISLVLIILIMVGGVSALVLMGKNVGNVAYVYQNSKEIKKLDLKVDQLFEIKSETDYNIVKVKNGKVGVVETNCAGHDCVKMGFLNKANAAISCLPHKIVIVIKKE